MQHPIFSFPLSRAAGVLCLLLCLSPTLRGQNIGITSILKQLEEVKSADGMEVVLNSDISFESGKATLKPAAKVYLDSIVLLMEQLPKMSMVVHGHTDNIGETATNQALSQKRADSVKVYLVSQGVEQERLSVVAHGEADPVAENTTEQGRARNRRVTFEVHVPPGDKLTDVLVFFDKRRLGVMHVSDRAGKDYLTYRRVDNNKPDSVFRNQVDSVYLADGSRYKVLQSPPPPPFCFQCIFSNYKKYLKYFNPNENIIKGNKEISLMYGFFENIGKRQYRSGRVIPPTVLSYSYSVRKGLMLRSALGVSIWQEGSIQYHYWVPSIGVSYFFQNAFIKPYKISPFVGMALSYRIARGCSECETYPGAEMISVNAYLGASYSLTNHWNAMIQVSNSEIAKIKTGFSYIIFSPTNK